MPCRSSSTAILAARLLSDLAPPLTDEEYLWEPVPGCWSIRPAGPGGRGAFELTWPDPEPAPAPVTTMASLVLHVSREALHHLAEVSLLRDLYRATGGARLA